MPGRGQLPMLLRQEREELLRQYCLSGTNLRQIAQEIFVLKPLCFARASSPLTVYECLRRWTKKNLSGKGSILSVQALPESCTKKTIDEVLESSAFRALLKSMPLGKFDRLIMMLKGAWPRNESEAVVRLKWELEESNLHIKELRALKCQEPEAHGRVRELEEQVRRLRKHAREVAIVGSNDHLPSLENFMVHHAG